MENNEKGGKWKEVLGWIVAILVVFLIFARRKQRTVNRFLDVFHESPVTAIVILVIAVAAAVGITLLRNYIRNHKK